MNSFLIQASTISLLILFLSPTLTHADRELIKDSDGKLLRNGNLYYIVPTLLGTGGLTWTPNTGSSPCPLFIKEELYTRGTPVRVSSPIKTLHIPTGYQLSLTFEDTSSPCSEPLEWSLLQENNGGSYAVAGGGNVLGYYTVEADEPGTGVYVIRHCLFARIYPNCFDLGIDKESSLLGINNGESLKIQFVKVDVEDEDSKVVSSM